MVTSSICKFADFQTPWYQQWSKTMGFHEDHVSPAGGSLRKIWEWAIISQALKEREMLTPGRTGIGFAVGKEPLAALFARHGVQVVATDRAIDDDVQQWASTSQHAASLDAVFFPDIIDRSEFDELVSFRPANMLCPSEGMNASSYDFLWSSCALEHLGTLQAGLDFIVTSLDLLKPGGLAIHTTEFNVSSNLETVELGPAVVYRRQDVERLDGILRANGCGFDGTDFECGSSLQDFDFDYPPFFQNGRFHIKLWMQGFVVTSAVMIIRKGAGSPF